MRNDGPPDLDELMKKFFGDFLGKGKSNNSQNYGDDDNNGELKVRMPGISNMVYLMILLGAFAVWFILGFSTINEKERAVVLRLGKFNEVLTPGLHWNPLFIDNVQKINVTTVRNISTSSVMLTQDENIIRANVSVQYIVSNPVDFILKIKDPEQALEDALESALRNEVGNSDMNGVLTTGRNTLAINVTTRLQSYMKLYNAGIEIIKVNIESTQAPTEVQYAFDDVIKAREDEARFVNQAIAYSNEILPKARGNAERIKKEAEGYKESLIAVATGEADRFNSLVVEYKKYPQLTRERLYQETVEQILSSTTKIMVDKNSGQQMMFLPLADIMKMDIKELTQKGLSAENQENARNNIETKNKLRK